MAKARKPDDAGSRPGWYRAGDGTYTRDDPSRVFEVRVWRPGESPTWWAIANHETIGRDFATLAEAQRATEERVRARLVESYQAFEDD